MARLHAARTARPAATVAAVRLPHPQPPDCDIRNRAIATPAIGRLRRPQSNGRRDAGRPTGLITFKHNVNRIL
ncbi:MAG: hypothetical protein LBJ23_08025 [Tannerella sp.]|nr:hypothetical protein [Tannerella sp.]